MVLRTEIVFRFFFVTQEDKIDQLKNEVEILKTLDHKNIIKGTSIFKFLVAMDGPQILSHHDFGCGVAAYETFSFKETRTLEIVMELCTGKENVDEELASGYSSTKNYH